MRCRILNFYHRPINVNFRWLPVGKELVDNEDAIFQSFIEVKDYIAVIGLAGHIRHLGLKVPDEEKIKIINENCVIHVTGKPANFEIYPPKGFKIYTEIGYDFIAEEKADIQHILDILIKPEIVDNTPVHMQSYRETFKVAASRWDFVDKALKRLRKKNAPLTKEEEKEILEKLVIPEVKEVKAAAEDKEKLTEKTIDDILNKIPLPKVEPKELDISVIPILNPEVKDRRLEKKEEPVKPEPVGATKPEEPKMAEPKTVEPEKKVKRERKKKE